MFSTGSFNATKLKSQLKMASSQIQIASNRKTSLLKQNMREIAMFLNEDPPKEEKARLRTEAFIRDDNITQAYDILNLQCNLLVEKVKLIEQSKNKKCPPDILSFVATLIFAEPYVDIKELSLIRKQLYAKYGKYFEEDALTNKGSIVNEKIALLLPINTPDPHLVQNYMTRICKQYEVDWKPSTITQTPPSNPPPPSSAASPIPAVAVRAISIPQNGPGNSKSDWVDEYEFYDIQTVDGVVSATVDDLQSRQKQDNLNNTASETIVEAVFVGEKPMPKNPNSFAQKSITYAETPSTDNSGDDDFVYLEHRPPATAPIEDKPTSTLTMIESLNLQEQESENRTINASKETISPDKESSTTDINIDNYKERGLSLQERLDILQRDHKEREKQVSNNSVEKKEPIEVLASERENIKPKVMNEEEEKHTVEENEGKGRGPEVKQIGLLVEEKSIGEETKVGENDAEEGQKEQPTLEIPDKTSKKFSMEQLRIDRIDNNDQSIVETNRVEEIENIIERDQSFADKPGKEQLMPDSQSKTIPLQSTVKSDMINSNTTKTYSESYDSTSARNEDSIEVLPKEKETSVPPETETVTINAETTTAAPVEPTKIGTDTEKDGKTSSNREEEKKARRMLTTAAGVAGGVAGLAAPAVVTGVFVGIGSALIANKIGKKIEKKQMKNDNQSFKKRNSIQDKASIAGNEILGKVKTFAGTIY